MGCSTLGFAVHHQLPELTQTHVHRVGYATQPSHLSSSSPAFNLSQNQGLFSESVLCKWWPKYCTFNFSRSPSNEYSGLISFRIDWFDLLSVQELSKSSLTPQFKSINSSALSFFIGQGNGTPLQYSCLENPMDGGAWWGLEESDMTGRLHFHFSLSRTGEGNGNPLQCSCLENPRDRGDWWAAIYRVAESDTTAVT